MDRHLAHIMHNISRYTSYPTAPQFNDEVNAVLYAAWLEEVAADATISLYLHVPFCRAICRYCDCHTKAAWRD